MTATRLLTVRIEREPDVVVARQRARQLAAAFHFDTVDQTRMATAVSELARNAFQYAGGGTVEYRIAGATAPQLLQVAVSDTGPGIADPAHILSGAYRSSTGMGLGIIGTRRLMDQFDLASRPGQTIVTIGKLLPPRAPFAGAAEIAAVSQLLTHPLSRDPVEELQQRNQELLQTLDLLRVRQEELERVNRELEDTNRGVVALYAELDERADHLRRADEVKTRFLSNMTHEFRTPVNSILALTRLLADRLAAAPDERDEVYYIRKSAQQLSDIVNDLLDLAKVEAGKIEVHPSAFEVDALFGALRGMLRPLLVSQAVSLVFDEPQDLPPLFSDENKISQILRNLISNALKYTERGEVRISAALAASRDAVTFTVADTGIGIPEADLPKSFDEFVQIQNPLQRQTKGTGLGLPLSRRLAELLGGHIGVDSVLGSGSTFRLTIPLSVPVKDAPIPALQPNRQPVLVIEDRDEDQLLVERMLLGTRFQPVAARTAAAAALALEAFRPAAVVLDTNLYGVDSWDILARLKRDSRLTAIPVLVVSTTADPAKAFALGAEACQEKPITRDWLITTLERVTGRDRRLCVLAIDDEETSRFIVRSLLNSSSHELLEAESGSAGLALARTVAPDVILLDFNLGESTAIDVCQKLAEDPVTARLPVVVVTSHELSSGERQALGDRPVIAKSAMTRDRLQETINRAMRRAEPALREGRDE